MVCRENLQRPSSSLVQPMKQQPSDITNRMSLPNFVTPHCHPASLDTASTLKAFVKREVELGTGYVTCTDHGSMGACRAIYDLARKNKLTPILGIEAYFRDDNCPILRAHGVINVPEYWKYAHVTLHALDQEAYEAMVRVLSKACLTRMERHGSEEKPLFDWADLEELGKYNITCGSGCLVGMIQRHFLVAHEDCAQIADEYFQRLQATFKPGNLFVEVFPHKTDKQWVNGVYLTFEDGTEWDWYEGKTLLVNSVPTKAVDLVEMFQKRKADADPLFLESVKNYQTWTPLESPKRIVNVRKVEEFVQNECFPWCPDGDSQKGTNRAMLYLANKYRVPVLVSDDSHFAYPEDKIVQDIRLQSNGGSWRMYGSYHRQTGAEAFAYFSGELGVSEEQFLGWVTNNYQWAEQFKGFTFKARRDLPVKFYPENTLLHLKHLIDKHGRMDWSNPVYTQRLRDEIEMLHDNGTIDLVPYFFPIEEVVDLYEKHTLLTGPGRGSAAGLLLSYVIGITHVDPIRYGLSKERFLTLDRIQNGKLPDIDQDLPHRDLLVNPDDPSKGWLKDRFGDCVAQISTDTMLKVRSSIKDVARVIHGGRVPEDIAKLAGQIPQAPQGVEDPDFIWGYEGGGGWVPGIIETDKALKTYIEYYPKEWEIVQKCLGLARQKSRHACAFVITNEPVSNFIPLTKIKDHIVTQYTAKSVEAAGGLKMDFLIINILNDIGAAIKLVQERHGQIEKRDYLIDGKRVPWHRVVPWQGKLYDVWDLPGSQSVFHDFCESETETVFQFNTPGAKQWLRLFNHVKNEEGDKALDSIEALAAFTALDRPGPLDYFLKDKEGNNLHNMLVEYSRRASGKDPVGAVEVLNDLLPETFGVIVYQEQLQKIYQVIGKTTAVEADTFRVHVGKKYQGYSEYRLTDRETFMKGAIETVGEETAEELWLSMETFGQYGFNKSHAVSYVIISYACAFLKHFYSLEWWTAVLRNADRNEIDEKFWRYCGHLVKLPDITKSKDTFEIVGNRIQAPLWLLHGVGKGAHEEIMAGRPYTNIREFVGKIRERRISMGTKIKKMVKLKGKENKGKPPVEVEALKLGHSALHRGVTTALIVSGAMDGLFPEDTGIYEKLMTYEQAWAEVNETKVKAIDPKWVRMNQIVRYQMRKQILPAYSEELLPLFVQRNVPGVFLNEYGTYSYRYNEDEYRFVSYAQFERAAALDLFEGPLTVAIAAYVLTERRFKYQKNSKEAADITFDHDGGRIKAVKWPLRNGKLPQDWPTDCEGAVVVAILTRPSDQKPFVLDDMIIVEPPLSEEKEESNGSAEAS